MSAMRVLVVDDDEEMRALLRTTLADFAVEEASTGEIALRLLRHSPVDLVVLDWKLPGSWGSQVLDVLKARYPSLPVLVLTVQTQLHNRLLAESLGADAYLTKPFHVAELLATVRSLLKDRG